MREEARTERERKTPPQDPKEKQHGGAGKRPTEAAGAQAKKPNDRRDGDKQTEGTTEKQRAGTNRPESDAKAHRRVRKHCADSAERATEPPQRAGIEQKRGRFPPT